MYKPPITIAIRFLSRPDLQILAEGFEVFDSAPTRDERLIYVGYGACDLDWSPGSPLPDFSKGWLLHVQPDAVTVRTDKIGLHPLYLMRTREGYLLTDVAGSLFGHPDFHADIDTVGFWQSLAYESPLRHRTLFAGIRQLGAAHEIRLTATESNPEISRYWCYSGFSPQEITLEEATEEACRLFSRAMEREFPVDADYLLPLSGGLDSRLMAVLLRNRTAPENISTLTYAHGRVSREFRISRDICRRLGLCPPHLHRLTPQSYLDGLKWLPGCSGGAVPFSNIHLLDYLARSPDGVERPIVAGTAYSDALCGYSASGCPRRNDDGWRNSALRKRIAAIDSFIGIDAKVLEENDADLAALAVEWRQSEITSFNEFIYIVERHVKFHHALARLWMLYGPVANPFLTEELRDFFFGLPPALRYQKVLESAVIDRLAPDLKAVASSSSLVIDGRQANRFQKMAMKGWNGMNTAIRWTLGPRFEIPDPYHTEQLAKVLNLSLKPHLSEAKRRLADLGLLSARQQRYFEKPLKRMGSTGTVQYFAINAAETFAQARGKEAGSDRRNLG